MSEDQASQIRMTDALLVVVAAAASLSELKDLLQTDSGWDILLIIALVFLVGVHLKLGAKSHPARRWVAHAGLVLMTVPLCAVFVYIFAGEDVPAHDLLAFPEGHCTPPPENQHDEYNCLVQITNNGDFELRLALRNASDGLIVTNSGCFARIPHSELLHLDLTECMEGGNVEFPKMHIDQRGASYRYNVDDNTWVEKNTNSLIWDLITSHDGQMEVGGKQFDVWSTEEVPAGEGKYCAGTDPLALDIEQDIQLKGWECSSGNALLEPVELTLEQCRGEDTAPPSIEGCQVAMPGARTSLETITASFEDKVLHCVAVEKRGVPIAECDPRYAIVHKRVNADLLDVDNSYFVEGSFEKSDAALPGKTNTMEVVRDHGGMDGVCADGSGDDGNFSISLFTRDGTYDSQRIECEPPTN